VLYKLLQFYGQYSRQPALASTSN